MSLWTLGTQAWVIQDRNYEDFTLGQRHSFAVTALPYSLERDNSAGAPQTRPLGDGLYAFSGAALRFFGYGAWVIDFGILCYGNAALPEGSMIGDVLAGEVRFFLPYPAVYEEGFDAAAPQSTYSWQIERIRLGTTSWLVGDDGVRRRDPNKIGYLDVESTNAETDDDGSAEYLLDCKLLGERGALWLRWDRLRRKARRRLRQARARRQEPGLVLPQLERGRWENLPPR